MSLFGSALRNELKLDSDIDLLVEFDQNHFPGLLDLAGMEIEMSEMIGRNVELRTPAELSRYFRDDVLKKCEGGICNLKTKSAFINILDETNEAFQYVECLSFDEFRNNMADS
jgi:hypothetical protein